MYGVVAAETATAGFAHGIKYRVDVTHFFVLSMRVEFMRGGEGDWNSRSCTGKCRADIEIDVVAYLVPVLQYILLMRMCVRARVFVCARAQAC